MNNKKILTILALAISLTACANINDNNKNENTDKKALSQLNENENSSNEDLEDQEVYDGLVKNEETLYDYFDTITIFSAYTKNNEDFHRLLSIFKDEMGVYHKLYNSYDNFDGVNNFSTINEKAGIEPVKVDKKIIDLIKYSKEMYKLTDGKINIAMGSLLGLWHDYREMSINNPDKAAIPDKTELEQNSKHKNIDAIEIDEKNSTVYINDKDVKIDIGAIGKGYAAKMIAQKLQEEGLEHGILSVGGDDVLIGTNPSSDDGLWRIAIQNPNLEDKENPYVDVISLRDSSIVTSGDYQRYFEVDGKRYHHIIDPDTMYPSTKWKSVSVGLDDIALADTLSTYLFIIDYEEGLKVAEKYGASVMWIDHDGKMYKTDSWSKMSDD